MKNSSLVLLFFALTFQSSLSQNLSLSPAPVGEIAMFANAKGGSPMLNLVMMDLRMNSTTKDLGETLGSPYSTEDFIKSEVFYEKESQGQFYIRYNALNSVIEIKKTPSPEEEAKRLYADKNVSVKYLNKVLRFTTYITKKNETTNGYLSLIMDGAQYKLYQKLAVKYSEGKAAANSMVADIPGRFTHFIEYYYQKKGIDRIDELPQSNSGLLKIIDGDKKDELKSFLKENKINTKEEADLIKVFEFLNKEV